jgi:hypothetical protein
MLNMYHTWPQGMVQPCLAMAELSSCCTLVVVSRRISVTVRKGVANTSASSGSGFTCTVYRCEHDVDQPPRRAVWMPAGSLTNYEPQGSSNGGWPDLTDNWRRRTTGGAILLHAERARSHSTVGTRRPHSVAPNRIRGGLRRTSPTGEPLFKVPILMLPGQEAL